MFLMRHKSAQGHRHLLISIYIKMIFFTKKRQSGFTLLEVLLALAIMAMLSLSGYLVLDGVVRAESQQRQALEKLRKIQRAVMIMDKDFQQIVARHWRDSRFQQPMFSLSPNDMQSDGGRVRFIRGGWGNPQGHFKRANLQLVGYRLNNQTLERLYWPHLDSNHQSATATILPLLEAVKTLKVEVFYEGRWQNSWRETDVLPTAVRVVIEFQPLDSASDGQRLSRVYRLR